MEGQGKSSLKGEGFLNYLHGQSLYEKAEIIFAAMAGLLIAIPVLGGGLLAGTVLQGSMLAMELSLLVRVIIECGECHLPFAIYLTSTRPPPSHPLCCLSTDGNRVVDRQDC